MIATPLLMVLVVVGGASFVSLLTAVDADDFDLEILSAAQTSEDRLPGDFLDAPGFPETIREDTARRVGSSSVYSAWAALDESDNLCLIVHTEDEYGVYGSSCSSREIFESRAIVTRVLTPGSSVDVYLLPDAAVRSGPGLIVFDPTSSNDQEAAWGEVELVSDFDVRELPPVNAADIPAPPS